MRDGDKDRMQQVAREGERRGLRGGRKKREEVLFERQVGQVKRPGEKEETINRKR